MNNDMISGLFAALDGIPDLRNARCRGHDEIFDEYADPYTTKYCVSLCRSCPALSACQEWLDGLPVSLRPYGVVAGKVRWPRNRSGAHRESA